MGHYDCVRLPFSWQVPLHRTHPQSQRHPQWSQPRPPLILLKSTLQTTLHVLWRTPLLCKFIPTNQLLQPAAWDELQQCHVSSLYSIITTIPRFWHAQVFALPYTFWSCKPFLDYCMQEFTTVRVCNSHMVSILAVWIGWCRQSAMNMLNRYVCELIASLLIFTADCLCHPNGEWRNHTLLLLQTLVTCCTVVFHNWYM